MKRIISLLMIALILVTAVPYAGFSVGAVSEETEKYTLTLENTFADSFTAEGSAVGGLSFFGNTEFDGCYGNQLSDVARELYDSLVKNYAEDKITEGYTHTFETPFTFDAEISGGSIVRNDELEEISFILSYSIQVALDAFLYDHPEVFWLRLIRSSYSISASGSYVSGYTGYIRKITITPTEIYSGASAEISRYDSAVNSALASVTATESRYETLKNIHDYICNNAWYNLVGEQRVHSSEPFFIGDGGMVCEGYAKTFKVLCDRLDIPCILVSGDAGGPHMWNYVQMDDGRWYLVDATWDDQESRIYDTYFLANANTVGFDGVTISRERTERNDFSGTGMFSFTYPVLSTKAYTIHVHEWDSDYTVDTEPTCTEKGSKSIHCKSCDETKSVTEIPALTHSWNSGVINPASTCKTHGTKTYTCQRDTSHSYTEQVALDSGNHEGGTYLKNKADATCTSAGYTGDACCSGCNVKLVTGKTVAALGHSMSAWSKNNNGTHSKSCGRDNCNYTETANCTYGVWNITKSATCSETGSKSKSCTDCGYTVTESIAKLPHTPAAAVTENRVEPKCEVKGSYDEVVYCSVCDTELSRTKKEIPALTHSWNSGVINPASTCKTHGTKTYTCQRDTSHSYTEQVALDSGNHEGGTYLKNKADATCTLNGYTGDTCCSGCNVKLVTGKTVAALGHSMSAWSKNNNGTHSKSCGRDNCDYTETANCTYGVWNITKSATCSETGSKSKSCTDCGYTVTESIAKLPHTPAAAVTENRVEPKCEVKGSYDEVVYCSVCDAELSRIEKEIPALGHTEVSDKAVAPDCVNTGLTEGKHCSVCSKVLVEQKDIPAKGHGYNSEVTEPTCTSKGYTTHTCSVCGNGYTDTFTNAQGHSYTSQIIKSADCISDGSIKYLCGACGETHTEIIGAYGHSYSSVYTVDEAADYKKEGSKSKHCTREGCTAKASVTVIPKLKLGKVNGVKATPSATSVRIVWSKVTGAESYKAELLNSKGKVIKTTTTKKTSCTFKKLSKATAYKVRVRAVAGTNNGAYSSVYTTSTAPAKVTVTELRSKKAKILTPVWKKVSGASGYEVQYSTSKKFTAKTTKSKKLGAGTTKYTFKNLKSGKKYYVRIRAYKTVGKTKIYSEWSKVKSIKVK